MGLNCVGGVGRVGISNSASCGNRSGIRMNGSDLLVDPCASSCSHVFSLNAKSLEAKVG